jgi:undecaprenyl-diphosphatase
MHLGTLGSILFAFREKLKELLSVNMLVAVVVAALPAGIIGFIFEGCIETTFGSPVTIALSLALWGFAMIGADRWSRGRTFRTTELSHITLFQAAFVGLAQILALIPGTSRSGITTIAGIISGMSPTTALAFSFLSGIPLLAGSGLYGLFKQIASPEGTSSEMMMIVLATLVSAVIGIAAAYVLKNRINKGILTICGLYRIILSTAVVAVIIL